MNEIAFLLMMMSQMDNEDIVMLLKKVVKRDIQKTMKEVCPDKESQILICHLFKETYNELEKELKENE